MASDLFQSLISQTQWSKGYAYLAQAYVGLDDWQTAASKYLKMDLNAKYWMILVTCIWLKRGFGFPRKKRQ